MTSENGCHEDVERNRRPQHSLHIVDSVAGVDRWRALWDWLLAPDPPRNPAAGESEVANGDSQNKSMQKQGEKMGI